MTELWTTDDAATHFGVSASRARAILAAAGVHRVSGYDADAVRNIQRPGQGARTDLKESAMTTTTIHGPNGTTELNGWYDFINGADYTDAQQKELAETLLHEQANELNALLPDGWTWYPSTSEIIVPVDDEADEELDLDELVREASEAVQARYEEIEAAAFARLAE